MLEAMNGFLLLLDRKKKILYVSDGVATHLGIDQVRLPCTPISPHNPPSHLKYCKVAKNWVFSGLSVDNQQSSCMIWLIFG